MQADLTDGFGTDANNETSLNGEKSTDGSSEATTTDIGRARSSQGGQVEEIHDSEIAEWVAERKATEQCYGYYHLYVVAESRLSGTEYRLKIHRKIDHPSPDDSPTTISNMFGMGATDPPHALDQIIEWKLDYLAKPFHPTTRDIPADRLQVFVAEPAREKLREHGEDVDAVVSTLNSLDEHEPDDQQIEKATEYVAAKNETKGTEATKERRVRAIGQTLRARLGFTSRLGHEVPEPIPEYEGVSTDDLERELNDAREDLEQTEQRRDELRKELQEERAEWKEATRSNLFPKRS